MSESQDQRAAECNAIEQVEQQGFVLHCARCDYRLTGLDPASNCPECGLEISHSLRTNQFIDVDPLFVARVAVGTALLAIRQLTELAAGLSYWMPIDDRSPTGQLFHDLYRFTQHTAILIAIGAWLVTGRDVPLRLGGRIPRRDVLLRCIGIARFFVATSTLAWVSMGTLGTQWCRTTLQFAFGILLLFPLRELAHRLGNPSLHWHVTSAMSILVGATLVRDVSVTRPFLTSIPEPGLRFLSLVVTVFAAYVGWVLVVMTRALWLTAQVARDNWTAPSSPEAKIAEKSVDQPQ